MSAVEVQQVPKKYFRVLVEYTVPFGIGSAAGIGIKSMASAASGNIPRLFGFGVDDIVTVGAGALAMLKGDDFVPREMAEAFGAGVLTSWVLTSVVPKIVPQATEVARSYLGTFLNLSNTAPSPGIVQNTLSPQISGFADQFSRDVNSVPFSGAVKGGSGEDFFYNRAVRFAI